MYRARIQRNHIPQRRLILQNHMTYVMITNAPLDFNHVRTMLRASINAKGTGVYAMTDIPRLKVQMEMTNASK